MSSRNDDIYQERIMDHYEDPFHRGTCDHYTHEHEANNPLCGDVIRVQLRISPDQKIEEAWFDGEGCVISQSAASMLMEKIEGLTLDEVRRFSAQQMLELFGSRLLPNRQKCCLLSWRVVQSALHSPTSDEEAAREGGPRFQGPQLGEES
jgi:nitrogen fixation NifU-like protein